MNERCKPFTTLLMIVIVSFMISMTEGTRRSKQLYLTPYHLANGPIVPRVPYWIQNYYLMPVEYPMYEQLTIKNLTNNFYRSSLIEQNPKTFDGQGPIISFFQNLFSGGRPILTWLKNIIYGRIICPTCPTCPSIQKCTTICATTLQQAATIASQTFKTCETNGFSPASSGTITLSLLTDTTQTCNYFIAVQDPKAISRVQCSSINLGSTSTAGVWANPAYDLAGKNKVTATSVVTTVSGFQIISSKFFGISIANKLDTGGSASCTWDVGSTTVNSFTECIKDGFTSANAGSITLSSSGTPTSICQYVIAVQDPVNYVTVTCPTIGNGNSVKLNSLATLAGGTGTTITTQGSTKYPTPTNIIAVTISNKEGFALSATCNWLLEPTTTFTKLVKSCSANGFIAADSGQISLADLKDITNVCKYVVSVQDPKAMVKVSCSAINLGSSSTAGVWVGTITTLTDSKAVTENSIATTVSGFQIIPSNFFWISIANKLDTGGSVSCTWDVGSTTADTFTKCNRDGFTSANSGSIILSNSGTSSSICQYVIAVQDPVNFITVTCPNIGPGNSVKLNSMATLVAGSGITLTTQSSTKYPTPTNIIAVTISNKEGSPLSATCNWGSGPTTALTTPIKSCSANSFVSANSGEIILSDLKDIQSVCEYVISVQDPKAMVKVSCSTINLGSTSSAGVLAYPANTLTGTVAVTVPSITTTISGFRIISSNIFGILVANKLDTGGSASCTWDVGLTTANTFTECIKDGFSSAIAGSITLSSLTTAKSICQYVIAVQDPVNFITVTCSKIGSENSVKLNSMATLSAGTGTTLTTQSSTKYPTPTNIIAVTISNKEGSALSATCNWSLEPTTTLMTPITSCSANGYISGDSGVINLSDLKDITNVCEYVISVQDPKAVVRISCKTINLGTGPPAGSVTVNPVTISDTGNAVTQTTTTSTTVSGFKIVSSNFFRISIANKLVTGGSASCAWDVGSTTLKTFSACVTDGFSSASSGSITLTGLKTAQPICQYVIAVQIPIAQFTIVCPTLFLGTGSVKIFTMNELAASGPGTLGSEFSTQIKSNIIAITIINKHASNNGAVTCSWSFIAISSFKTCTNGEILFTAAAAGTINLGGTALNFVKTCTFNVASENTAATIQVKCAKKDLDAADGTKGDVMAIFSSDNFVSVTTTGVTSPLNYVTIKVDNKKIGGFLDCSWSIIVP